jgi:hypothetical protein
MFNLRPLQPTSRQLAALVFSWPLIAFADFVPVDPDGVFDDPVFTPFDAKTYPGINCEAQAVAEIDQFLNVGFFMSNANPGKRTVVCPVVRDNTRNLDGTYSAYVHAYNPAGRTLECTLYSQDKFSAPVDSFTASTSTSGNVTLYLDVDTSAEEGFYGITCLLANTATVYSYEVREFLATDPEYDNPFQIP